MSRGWRRRTATGRKGRSGAGGQGRPAPAHARHAGVRRWVVLVVLCVTLLVISLDATILNVAIPTVARSLPATSSQLQWIVDAYSVVFAGLLLVLGSTGDRLGRKKVFMAGLGVFAAGSAAAAFSGSPGHLMAARAVMGAGAAGIMPSTLSILSNVFTEESERANAIGIWSASTGVGVAAGPIVGGWLLAHYWWGSVFLVNVPIAAIGIVAASLLVPDSRNLGADRPDPAGAGLSTVGLAVLLWGIIEAPGRSWSSPVIVAALAGGVGLLACFVAWERHCDHPMLRVAFFRSRRFSAAIGAMALVLFGLLGAFFLETQWLQFNLGYSPLQTGFRVAPIALVVLVAAPGSSVLARLAGTKPVVFAGMASIAAGLFLLSRTTVAGGYADALPAYLAIGLGTGLALAPSIESVLGSLPPAEAGVGSATSDTALQLGGAVGVAVLGTALNARYGTKMAAFLAGVPLPEGVRHTVLGSVGGALAVASRAGGAAGGRLAAVARQSFVSGMDLGLLLGAAVVATAAVVVLVVLPNRAPGGTTPRRAARRLPGGRERHGRRVQG